MPWRKMTVSLLKRFPTFSPDLKMLDIDGFTLQAEAFQGILKVLVMMRDVFKFFAGGAKKEIYPKLYDITRDLSNDEGLMKAITAVFDEKGEIRPDASPELMRIRRDTQHKIRELDGRFRQIIQEYRSKGWLSDSPESFRNGRRVLSPCPPSTNAKSEALSTTNLTRAHGVYRAGSRHRNQQRSIRPGT
jgi:DNA mismatch repair protein MutS2